jgi:hypothetical protein
MLEQFLSMLWTTITPKRYTMAKQMKKPADKKKKPEVKQTKPAECPKCSGKKK